MSSAAQPQFYNGRHYSPSDSSEMCQTICRLAKKAYDFTFLSVSLRTFFEELRATKNLVVPGPNGPLPTAGSNDHQHNQNEKQQSTSSISGGSLSQKLSDDDDGERAQFLSDSEANTGGTLENERGHDIRPLMTGKKRQVDPSSKSHHGDKDEGSQIKNPKVSKSVQQTIGEPSDDLMRALRLTDEGILVLKKDAQKLALKRPIHITQHYRDINAACIKLKVELDAIHVEGRGDEIRQVRKSVIRKVNEVSEILSGALHTNDYRTCSTCLNL